jgi:hypothetical protein
MGPTSFLPSVYNEGCFLTPDTATGRTKRTPIGQLPFTAPYLTFWNCVGPFEWSPTVDRRLRPSVALLDRLRSRSRRCFSTANSSTRAPSSTGSDEFDTSVHLNVAERWWRDHQPWLERCGYFLRPRYRQDWIPSWERKGFFSELHAPEDIIELPVCFALDSGFKSR